MKGPSASLPLVVNPIEKHFGHSISNMSNEEYAVAFNMTPLYQELFKLYLSENFEDHQKDSEEFFEFFLQKLIESNKSDFYSLKNYALISANTFQRHGFLITLKNVFMYSKSSSRGVTGRGQRSVGQRVPANGSAAVQRLRPIHCANCAGYLRHSVRKRPVRTQHRLERYVQ